MQATLAVGKLKCSTLVHCIASSCAAQVDHFLHSAPKCVKTSVQGADHGTSTDAGAVQGPAPVDVFKGRPPASNDDGM